jgi:hypothetical protein
MKLVSIADLRQRGARDTLGFFGLFGARIQVRTTNGASLRNRAGRAWLQPRRPPDAKNFCGEISC